MILGGNILSSWIIFTSFLKLQGSDLSHSIFLYPEGYVEGFKVQNKRSWKRNNLTKYS